MSRPQDSVSSLADWKARSLRLTAYASPAGPFAPVNWWQELVGQPPEKTRSTPRIDALQEEGSFENQNLVLDVQPNRMDWVLKAIPGEERLDEIPLMGPFSELLDPFTRLMLRWLEISPPIQRLAFGAILMKLVKDRVAGNKDLSKFLKKYVHQLEPGGPSDFLYRINRPRPSQSGIIDLTINRLSTWTVQGWKGERLTIEPGMFHRSSTPEAFAIRVDLDINTAAEFTSELSPEKLPIIFEELLSLGKEIATKGDTR